MCVCVCLCLCLCVATPRHASRVGPASLRALRAVRTVRRQMTQSAGWCIGFAFSPPNRMAPIVQLLATAATFAIGTMLTVPELPVEKSAPDDASYHRLEEDRKEKPPAEDQI